MQNVLRNLVRRSYDQQDTANSNSGTIDTGSVLPRGIESSALLEIELSSINMDAAVSNEGNDMYIVGASVIGAPDGNITHQYADDLSLEEAELYKRWMEDMKKGTTA